MCNKIPRESEHEHLGVSNPYYFMLESSSKLILGHKNLSDICIFYCCLYLLRCN